jgi:hypothetical protein
VPAENGLQKTSVQQIFIANNTIPVATPGRACLPPANAFDIAEFLICCNIKILQLRHHQARTPAQAGAAFVPMPK